ncbi:hypothetical protein LCGC14_2547020 [marine sediment metagenome]|uniref:Uncharacterized protein n=1 Tax=marine sediment metagenome TaxID=412755 RepID=A0A0F9API9_9ZZZZ
MGAWQFVRQQFEFEPRDLWVGVYWDKHEGTIIQCDELDIYVCLLPTLVWHWNFVRFF